MVLLSTDGTTSSAWAAAAKLPVSTARQNDVRARSLSMRLQYPWPIGDEAARIKFLCAPCAHLTSRYSRRMKAMKQDGVPPGIGPAIDAWARAWNAHDMKAAADLVDPNVDFVTVAGLWLRSRDEFL